MARDAVYAAARELLFAVPLSHTEDVPLLGAVGWARPGGRARLHPGARPLPPCRSTTSPAATGRSPFGSWTSSSRTGRWLPAGGRRDLSGRRGPVRGPQRGRRRTWTTCSRAARTSPSRCRIAGAVRRRRARLMAPLLEWDEATMRHEIEHYCCGWTPSCRPGHVRRRRGGCRPGAGAGRAARGRSRPSARPRRATGCWRHERVGGRQQDVLGEAHVATGDRSGLRRTCPRGEGRKAGLLELGRERVPQPHGLEQGASRRLLQPTARREQVAGGAREWAGGEDQRVLWSERIGARREFLET